MKASSAPVLGAFLMTVIKSGAVHTGMPGFAQKIATGVIIVVAVAIDRARHARWR
jgi:ribose/xylose/arabinose/galactoside ABC-type transport system permease subunit